MNYKVFHTKAIGASHIKNNLVCQDNVSSIVTDKYAILALADGHGGAKYFRSDRGSKFAVDSAIECVSEFLDNINADEELKQTFIDNSSHDDYFLQLEKSIIAKWYEKVEFDLEIEPFDNEELDKLDEKSKLKYLDGERLESAYGTTLISFVYTDNFCFGIHIGDGKCIMCDKENGFSEPIPWDEKCFLNVTTSICDSDAINNFRNVFLYGEKPIAVFIASDGVDDCFSNSDENEQLYSFYRKVLEMFSEKDEEFAKKELEEYLPILSEKGSKDDVSIAMIYSLDEIYEFASLAKKELEDNDELVDGVSSDNNCD